MMKINSGNQYLNFVIRIFSTCNPIWLTNLINSKQIDKDAVKHIMRKWYGIPSRSLPSDLGWAPNGEPLHHVFPIVLSQHDEDEGLMVGLKATPLPVGKEWHLSDAFGRMGFADSNEGLCKAFEKMFEYVESAWLKVTGHNLPLRWRYPFEISLISPVHIDLIGGESLQVPLLITLLRAVISRGDASKLPWGEVPVFSTGTIEEKGRFGEVEYLEPKLRGFLREFGDGLPAVLTEKQQLKLSQELLKRVHCVTANRVEDLLRIKEIGSGLREIDGPPHVSEIERMLETIELHRGAREFKHVTRLTGWMEPHLKNAKISSYYRSIVALRQAEMALHSADYRQARGQLNKIKVSPSFGSDLFVDYLACCATMYYDIGFPEEGIQKLESFKSIINAASPKNRTAYWGSLCQLYRAAGRYRDAVAAGKLAVSESKKGRISETHVDINYLVHAWIALAKNVPSCRKKALAQAQKLLKDSSGKYAPPAGTNSYRTHSIFCLHLEAECARLASRPFTLPRMPVTPLKIWEHAWLFALFSVARNETNSLQERNRALTCLLEISCECASGHEETSVFSLFDAVYRIYRDYFHSNSINTKSIRLTLIELKKIGLGGWDVRLKPVLDQIDRKEDIAEAVEKLSDAVYFH